RRHDGHRAADGAGADDHLLWHIVRQSAAQACRGQAGAAHRTAHDRDEHDHAGHFHDVPETQSRPDARNAQFLHASARGRDQRSRGPPCPGASQVVMTPVIHNKWYVEPEPQEETESWLLTYLDMITLLLVLLVAMLTLS